MPARPPAQSSDWGGRVDARAGMAIHIEDYHMSNMEIVGLGFYFEDLPLGRTFQTIGRTILLYRRHPETPEIKLPQPRGG